MSARNLVIGIDGADLSLINQLGPSQLPALFSLMDGGVHAALESVQPPATLPNWTTFLTGLDPAQHGVFDFTMRDGYQVRFTAGAARERPTLAARLDELSLRCACLGFPATYPPEQLRHGFFLSGWDSPVAFDADKSFAWPSWLYDAIKKEFGKPSFDDVDEFKADHPEWHQRLPDALTKRIERKTELFQWVLRQRDWDLMMVYFGETDTAAHYLWGLMDPDSPRHQPGLTDGLPAVYRAMDRAVAELVSHAGDGVEVTLLSDHGSGGSSDKVLYLNRVLESAGLLTMKTEKAKTSPWASMKEIALTRFPPSLKQRLFRLGKGELPGMLESRNRFGAIDMKRTACFSEELNYFPCISLNLKGREPEGTVDPGDAPRVIREIEDALLALRDPWTGAPVVEKVERREELFEGPYLERAPDLLLTLHLDSGYSYNLGPSAIHESSFRKLKPSEYLGRKGRTLPGSHRSHGFFAASGPSVAEAGKIDAHISDVTATLLARMGLGVPNDFRGRVLWECLRETQPVTDVLPDAERRQGSAGDEEKVVERLRALGYVD